MQVVVWYMQDADKCILPLKEAQLQEASQMLTDILAVRTRHSGKQHINVAEAACVLSLLYLCLKDHFNAKQNFQSAQMLLSQQAETSKFEALLGTACVGLQVAVGH